MPKYPSNPEHQPIDAVCPVCGKDFIATWNYHLGKHKIYCSQECRRQHELLRRRNDIGRWDR